MWARGGRVGSGCLVCCLLVGCWWGRIGVGFGCDLMVARLVLACVRRCGLVLVCCLCVSVFGLAVFVLVCLAVVVATVLCGCRG